KTARDTLFEENIGLIWSVVKRFRNRGVEMEDLFQIGSIGLLKAVDHFNLDYEVKFSTYAVPMIAGEIKRFLRDDGMIRVSRSLKEISYKAYSVRERLEKELNREPTVEEIAQAAGVSVEDLMMATEAAAEIESLQKVIYQGDGAEISLQDKLPERENAQEQALDRLFLEEILQYLEPDERRLIYMRYFRNMTQTQVAKKLGVSQVQVSRMEKKILKIMRRKA
ncbi:MAG: SigB/SigF/SigG family RNA polymerase sigma factor, partial [Lachnospiraceae bacterium]|nr:SigB/SigF/SigG family RNA polymerase sigma factor [Lachnospiraceae bacterium]